MRPEPGPLPTLRGWSPHARFPNISENLRRSGHNAERAPWFRTLYGSLERTGTAPQSGRSHAPVSRGRPVTDGGAIARLAGFRGGERKPSCVERGGTRQQIGKPASLAVESLVESIQYSFRKMVGHCGFLNRSIPDSCMGEIMSPAQNLRVRSLYVLSYARINFFLSVRKNFFKFQRNLAIKSLGVAMQVADGNSTI